MIRIPRGTLFAAVLALSACADPALEQRVVDLETKQKDLEAKLEASASGARKGGATVDPEREKAAGELLRTANTALEEGKYDDAKSKLDTILKDYGDTRAAKRAERLAAEASVVGSEAGDLQVDSWFQGDTSFTEGEATLVVFFETWCPHCQREVPKLQQTYDTYKKDGLNVVALTKVTKSSTDDKVREFIKEQNIGYPVAKEKSGSMSDKFAVTGIPAAAVVKDGKVVWRGHPGRLNDDMIKSWVN